MIPRVSLLLAVILSTIMSLYPSVAKSQILDQILKRNKESPHVQVSLLNAYEGTRDQEKVLLGIQFKIDESYKIFWRSPGIAGMPVSLDISGSQNVESEKIFWPYPTHFKQFGAVLFGYKNEVILPLEISLKDPEEETNLVLGMEFLLCTPNACLPQKRTLTKTLLPTIVTPTPDKERIETFLRKVPEKGRDIHFYIKNVEIANPNDAPPALTISAYSKEGFNNPSLYVESPDDLFIDLPEIAENEDKHNITYQATIYENEYKEIKQLSDLYNKTVILTLVDGEKSIESQHFIVLKDYSFTLLFIMLAIAFLGGFLINFLPSTLPIMLIPIIEDTSYSTKRIRHDFVAISLGIILSFLCIAAIIILLKIYGFQIIIGSHLQFPFILIIMSIFITFLMCILFGLLHKGSTSYTPILTQRTSGYIANTELGIIAVILSLPFFAPIIGVSMNFALNYNVQELALTICMVGLGFAFPYMLIALFPKLEKILPKPGKWVPLTEYASSLLLVTFLSWVLYVIALQYGYLLLAATMTLCLATFILLRVYRLKNRLFVVMGIILVAGYLTPNYIPLKPIETQLPPHFEPFDHHKIKQYLEEEKTVLVDVTAPWCSLCMLNNVNIFKNDEIIQLLKSENIIAMRLYWDATEDETPWYLTGYGRYSLPLNVIYTPDSPNGIILPEYLTKEIVHNALQLP